MKYYLVIINLILISTLSWFTAGGIYGNLDLPSPDNSVSASGKKPDSQKSPVKTKKMSVKPESSYGVIDKRNLFKTEETKTASLKKEPEKTLTDLEKLKKTSLNLQLLGTIIGSSLDPYAIIFDKKVKKQDLYNVGDKIQKAEIKLILNKKVVLNVNGKDEILTMEVTSTASGKAASGPGIDRGSVSRTDTGISKKVNVNLKRDYIDGIIENPLSVISDARVRPYLKNGQTSGLIISHIKRNSVFSKAGLKNGDIIKAINGEEIESMDNMMGYYENLKNESNINVSITRRGRNMQIDYSIE